MYKGKKYNVIIVLLLFIISAVVGVSAGMSSAGFDNPLLAESDESSSHEQEVELPTGVKPPSATANPLTKVLFALDIVNNGKGYKSHTYQSLTVMGVPQEMYFQKLRGGGLSLSEEWFKFSGSGILAGFGKNEYRSVLDDGETLHTKLVTDKSKFNQVNRMIDYTAEAEFFTKAVAQYTGEENRYPLNDFFIDVKSEYLSDIKEDKRKDKDNYIITVVFNTNAIPSKYLATFSANGGDGVKILSLELKFFVSKTNGMLKKVEKNETFSASYAGVTAPSPAETFLREEYFAMNISQENEIKRIAKESYDITL